MLIVGQRHMGCL